jgi:hypothetical protein
MMTISHKGYKPCYKSEHYHSIQQTDIADVLFFRDDMTHFGGTTTRYIFHALAEKWKRETGHLSIVQQKAMHPFYQAIIGLGEKALPILIKELDQSPRDWFWALRAITRENPVDDDVTVEEAVESWKKWWIDRNKKHGVLDFCR